MDFRSQQGGAEPLQLMEQVLIPLSQPELPEAAS